jgi:hypothetical protein
MEVIIKMSQRDTEKENKIKTFTFLSPDDFSKVKKIAKANEMSVSSFVRLCVSLILDDLEKDNSRMDFLKNFLKKEKEDK